MTLSPTPGHPGEAGQRPAAKWATGELRSSGPGLLATGGVSVPLGFGLNRHGPPERSHFLPVSGGKAASTSLCHFCFISQFVQILGGKRAFKGADIRLDQEDREIANGGSVRKLL